MLNYFWYNFSIVNYFEFRLHSHSIFFFLFFIHFQYSESYMYKLHIWWRSLMPFHHSIIVTVAWLCSQNQSPFRNGVADGEKRYVSCLCRSHNLRSICVVLPFPLYVVVVINAWYLCMYKVILSYWRQAYAVKQTFSYFYLVITDLAGHF